LNTSVLMDLFFKYSYKAMSFLHDKLHGLMSS
jgi:hypothetical protein